MNGLIIIVSVEFSSAATAVVAPVARSRRRTVIVDNAVLIAAFLAWSNIEFFAGRACLPATETLPLRAHLAK